MKKWEYETCKICNREQRIAWSVNNYLWKRVMGDYQLVVCLECFLKEADEKSIEVKAVHFRFLGWIGTNVQGDYVLDKEKGYEEK